MTPDEAISKLQGLPEDKQRAVLAQLSPDERKGILGKLKTSTPTGPEPRTVGNYLKEAVGGVGRGLANDVKGLASLRHPLDTIHSLAAQSDVAINAAEKEYQDLKGQPELTRHVAAALSGLENAPIIGGMVQKAEEGGGVIASPESVGAATEGITTFEAPKAVMKGVAKVLTAPESVRGAAQSMVGAGKRQVKSIVGKEAETANEARNTTLAANKAADEATLKARGKVDEKNVGTALSNANIATEAERQAAQLAQRNVAQSELDQVSREMDVAVEKARHDALEIGNKKYSGVNETLNPQLANESAIEGALNAARDKIKGSDVTPPILKSIAGKVAHEDYVSSGGQKFGPGTPLYESVKGSEGGIPKGESAPLSYKDLQGYYSELSRELSKGTLPGDIYAAYDTMHEAIGNEMQRIADANGQGAALTDARNYWKRMKQTFGKSSDTINNRASKAVRTANPNLPKQQANEYQLRLLASFDPEIGNLANRAKEIQGRLTSLPKKVSAPAAPTPRTEYAEPNATKPVEPPTVNTRNIREQLLDRWTTGESQLSKFQVRSLISGGFGAIAGSLLGRGEGAAIGGIAGSVFGPAAIARLVEMPAVREWLTRPPKGELETLQKLPNADRIRLTDGLRQVASQAQRQGIKVAPILTNLLSASVIAGSGDKKGVAKALQQ